MRDFPVDLDEVNAMDAQAFTDSFGDVTEAGRWVAVDAEADRPFASREAMVSAFATAIADGDPQQQMAVLRAHPELAAGVALTDESVREQRGAGLDRLTPEESSRIAALNTAYRERFGFPFIVAVRGTDKHAIMSSLAARLHNPPAAEFARALVEVQRIVRFRIEDRVRA